MLWVLTAKTGQHAVEANCCCIEPDGSFVFMDANKRLVRALAPGQWIEVSEPPKSAPVGDRAALQEWLDQRGLSARDRAIFDLPREVR